MIGIDDTQCGWIDNPCATIHYAVTTIIREVDNVVFSGNATDLDVTFSSITFAVTQDGNLLTALLLSVNSGRFTLENVTVTQSCNAALISSRVDQRLFTDECEWMHLLFHLFHC